MTLVPIIYTSLIIFASLLTVVIIFSYIAFRVRSGNRDKSVLNEPGYSYIPQPAPINLSSIKRVQSYAYPQPSSLIYPASYHGAPQNHMKQHEENLVARQNPKPQKNIRQSAVRERLSKTRQEDRLEIVNYSESFRRTSEFDDTHVQPKAALSDSNLLSYYSDRSDIEFSLMDTHYFQKAL